MITRILIVGSLVLSCSLCLAEDFPENTNEIKSLTAEEAAELAAKVKGSWLLLNGLTSIDKDVAQKLAKFEGYLYLRGLTSIDEDVAQELAKVKRGLSLEGLTSIDKGIAQELAKFDGSLTLRGLTSIDEGVAQELAKVKRGLYLRGLTSIDEVSLAYLKSNPKIVLPEKYND